MTVTNATKIKNLDKALLTIRDLVSEANRDGFGYALSYKNSIFAEKFLSPSDFKGLNESAINPKMNLSIFDAPMTCTYGERGAKGEKVLAIIAHGRTSTNKKGYVEYSHPFVSNDGQAFIHNGVVDVPRKHEYDLETSNDSEYLANVYWNKGLKGVSNVSGYMAFMNLQAGGQLSIVKDTASLYGAYCEELQSYIFATLENMIVRFAKEMNLTVTKALEVNFMTAFNVRLNEVSEMRTFKKTAKEKRLTALERRAFKDYGKDYLSSSSTTVAGTPTSSQRSFGVEDDASIPSRFKDTAYYAIEDWKEDVPVAKAIRREDDDELERAFERNWKD
jgi:hypothetical protein